MKGQALNSDHCVVVYASGGKIDGDIVDGEVFKRREIDTDGLSVQWLECFPSPRENQVAEIRKLARIRIRKSGRYAELNIGAVATAVAQELTVFLAVHDPLEEEAPHAADPSHSLFKGLPEFDEELADTIGDIIRNKVSTLHIPPNPDK